jgi:hypothetical protein
VAIQRDCRHRNSSEKLLLLWGRFESVVEVNNMCKQVFSESHTHIHLLKKELFTGGRNWGSNSGPKIATYVLLMTVSQETSSA